MSNTMPKYCVEHGGAGTSDPEDSSGATTSGPEDSSGAATSDPEESSGADTSSPGDKSGAGTSGPEDSSGADTSDPEHCSGANTRDPEDSSGADTSSPADKSGAGTSGPEDSSGADTSSPEDNSGAGTSGPVDKSGAGTSGLEDNSVAGTSGPEDSSRAVTSGSVTDPVPPMSDTENWFIEKRIDDIANKYEYDVSKRGKWIMHFDFDQMNAMWAKVCRLYTEGQLTGIQFVRTSTGINKEVQPYGGAIRFYCGPSYSEELVKSYGRNAASLMNYCERQRGCICFKSDEQTQEKIKGIYIYRLEVPRTERERRGECEDDVEAESLKPMSTMHRYYIYESSLEIHDRYKYDKRQKGHWTMTCRDDILDEAWRESCTLYRQEKLTGVQSMRVMTVGLQRTSKQIYFHCGPFSDKRLMMEYGRGIARQLGHYCSNQRMGYKVMNDETRIRLSKRPLKTEHLWKYIYTLDIK